MVREYICTPKEAPFSQVELTLDESPLVAELEHESVYMYYAHARPNNDIGVL